MNAGLLIHEWLVLALALGVLLADLWAEFDALTQHPAAVLAHIGSPVDLTDEPPQPLVYAA